MSGKKKKENLFKLGARAAGVVFGCQDTYICPICGSQFDRSALDNEQLTLEHVPPRSVGGKGILLTCKSCNSTAGHNLDAEVSKRAEVERFETLFTQNSPVSACRSKVIINNRLIRADISRTNETIDIKALQKINSPSHKDEVSQYFQNLAAQGKGDGEKIQISPHADYDKHKARISDLRCAFLACAAGFGYTFALSPILNRVRDQIRNPDQMIISRWWLEAPDAKNFRIYRCDDDNTVIVKFNNQTVILPMHTRSDDDIWPSLDEVRRVERTTRQLSWPTTFHADYDLMPKPTGT